jgi:ribosome-associated heat shock protein Hsp15
VDGVRLDKWLWAARFYKTRSLATDAVLGGHVHVGEARVKPSREVRVGETLEITQGPRRRTVVVTGLSDKRGPASVAQTLYEETAESIARGEQRRLERQAEPQPVGRPSKVDRRRLDALRRAMNRRG